jgi:hypothetical protein
LLARLVGKGTIADDEAQPVLAELRTLIGRHGPDALAVRFVREP